MPNFAHLTPRAGKWLKDEGKRAVVPDVMVAVRVEKSFGLGLEFKSETGRVSPAQHEWASLLTAHGWSVQVVRSAQDAWDALLTYLGEQ